MFMYVCGPVEKENTSQAMRLRQRHSSERERETQRELGCVRKRSIPHNLLCLPKFTERASVIVGCGFDVWAGRAARCMGERM